MQHTPMLFSFCDLAFERDSYLVMEATCLHDDNHLNHAGQRCSQCVGSGPADSFHSSNKDKTLQISKQ